MKLKICILRNRERKQAREKEARQGGEAKGGEGSAVERWFPEYRHVERLISPPCL